LATWALNTGSDGNNTGARQGPFGAGHALSMNRTTPNAPVGQRGPGGAFNEIYITSMTVQVAGPSGAVAVRGRVWNSSGGAETRSPAVTVPSNTGFSIGNVVFDLSDWWLNGGTSYRFGVWSTGDIRVQTSANSSFSVYADTSIGSNDNWSTGNSTHSFGSNFSLVGSFEYAVRPTAPSISSTSSSTSSVTVNWSAPSNNGDSTVTDYLIYHKPSFSGSWTIEFASGSARSYTVSGLSSSTTYDIRVSAANAVGESEYATTSITTDFVSTFSFSPAPPPQTTTVPNLTGLTLTQANTAISNASLSSSATAQPTGATAENNNLVISGTQSPSSGSTVNVGSTVSFQYYSYTPPAQEVSVWNGTSWVTSTPKIWNGTSWVNPTAIKVWNGTSWVNPT
jgi:hypothetical protein